MVRCGCFGKKISAADKLETEGAAIPIDNLGTSALSSSPVKIEQDHEPVAKCELNTTNNTETKSAASKSAGQQASSAGVVDDPIKPLLLDVEQLVESPDSPTLLAASDGGQPELSSQQQEDHAETVRLELKEVDAINRLLNFLRIPEAHTRAEKLIRKPCTSEARRALRQSERLKASPFGMRKLKEGFTLLFNEYDADDHLDLNIEYDGILVDARINISPHSEMKIFFDMCMLHCPMEHICAFMTEIDLLPDFVPYMKETNVINEFAGPADTLWRSRCKPPIPMHGGFECYHQRLCFDMLTQEESEMKMNGDLKGMLIIEFSPTENPWRAITIPEAAKKGPTRVIAKVVTLMAYPMRIKSSDKEERVGITVKGAIEADLQLPRWMIPNRLIKTIAGLVIKMVLKDILKLDAKWEESKYPERMRVNRHELYEEVKSRIHGHTKVISEPMKTYEEIVRTELTKNKLLCRREAPSKAGSKQESTQEKSKSEQLVPAHAQLPAGQLARSNGDLGQSGEGTSGTGLLGSAKKAKNKIRGSFKDFRLTESSTFFSITDSRSAASRSPNLSPPKGVVSDTDITGVPSEGANALALSAGSINGQEVVGDNVNANNAVDVVEKGVAANPIIPQFTDIKSEEATFV